MSHRSKRMRTQNCKLQDYEVQLTSARDLSLKKTVAKTEVKTEVKAEKMWEAISGLNSKPPQVPVHLQDDKGPKSLGPKVPFYYGDSARFTSGGKLYVDFDHMFRTVVLPHNLASAAYMQWINSDGPQSFMCFDFGCLPREHTSSTPFNVCADHARCQAKTGRKTPCACHSPVHCSSEKACVKLVEQRREAFHASWVAYSKEEKIATCTDFWDYLFAGEEKLPKEQRSLTQQDMLMRIWKQRPKALFFLKHVFNPSATPEGVINLV